jgi:arabinose-5-phosphate isomerase
MLKSLFAQQREYLQHFFDQIDYVRADAFLQACLECKGLILLTGTGKSGIIGEKIAMTLVSTGTRALFLPPGNLLHGDLGVMTSEDLFVMISKSGETEELLSLIPFVRKRGAKILAITSNARSRLAKEADIGIELPVSKELCPFDLAPTTSTAVQLLFGDALAVALMKAKSFTIHDFSMNHPAGTLGRKMTLTVEDLMWHGDAIPLCFLEDKLSDVMETLSDKKCGCLLVVDKQKKLLGVFTDGDLRRGLQKHGSALLEYRMKSLTEGCSVILSKELLAWEAVKILQKDPKRWVTVAPVVSEEKVVGILRMHDVINAGLAS